MRDEKEGRKEGRKKVKQTTRQSNTAHPRQSLFLRKMSCLRYIHVYIHVHVHCLLYEHTIYTCYTLQRERESHSGSPHSLPPPPPSLV